MKSPAQITSVKFMVWTDSKGQDDVKWYEGVHSGNVWYADVSAKNHIMKVENIIFIVMQLIPEASANS